MDYTNHKGLLAATGLIRLDKRYSYSTQFKFWVSRDPARPTPRLYMIVRIFKHHPICNDLGVSPEMRVSQINFKGKQKSEASQDATAFSHGKNNTSAFLYKKIFNVAFAVKNRAI